MPIKKAQTNLQMRGISTDRNRRQRKDSSHIAQHTKPYRMTQRQPVELPEPSLSPLVPPNAPFVLLCVASSSPASAGRIAICITFAPSAFNRQSVLHQPSSAAAGVWGVPFRGLLSCKYAPKWMSFINNAEAGRWSQSLSHQHHSLHSRREVECKPSRQSLKMHSFNCHTVISSGSARPAMAWRSR
jgi:hypothetical protein